MRTRDHVFQSICLICFVFLFFAFSSLFTSAQAGDETAARAYIVKRAAELKWPCMLPDDFIKFLLSGKKIAFIDVRSELETAVWYPKSDKAMDTFVIPLQQIPARLGDIHPEKYDYVVLTCPTGPRAAAAAVLARLMGYDNVYFFRGGNKALGSITGTKFRKAAKKLLQEGKIKKVPEWME